MKAVLGPLAAVAGVRVAMLVSPDGVPIVVRGESRQQAGKEHVEDTEALAALTAGWISEIGRAIAPISWNPPRHLVLRASRGTLIAMQAHRALLVVVLGRGVQPSELRIPMESALARMERGLRGESQPQAPEIAPSAAAAREQNAHPQGIFPSRHTAPKSEADAIDIAQYGTAEPNGPTGE